MGICEEILKKIVQEKLVKKCSLRFWVKWLYEYMKSVLKNGQKK